MTQRLIQLSTQSPFTACDAPPDTNYPRVRFRQTLYYILPDDYAYLVAAGHISRNTIVEPLPYSVRITEKLCPYRSVYSPPRVIYVPAYGVVPCSPSCTTVPAYGLMPCSPSCTTAPGCTSAYESAAIHAIHAQGAPLARVERVEVHPCGGQPLHGRKWPGSCEAFVGDCPGIRQRCPDGMVQMCLQDPNCSAQD